MQDDEWEVFAEKVAMRSITEVARSVGVWLRSGGRPWKEYGKEDTDELMQQEKELHEMYYGLVQRVARWRTRQNTPTLRDRIKEDPGREEMQGERGESQLRWSRTRCVHAAIERWKQLMCVEAPQHSSRHQYAE